MLFRLLPVALLATVLLTPAGAQTGLDAPDRRLVVLNLAGHPDDEDGLTMAYYRGHQDAVVYSVIATRGEGGQNEAGPDLYERLGAIRTQETEAAARILGTRVLYLNRYDFGFSKHAEETFTEWSRQRRGFYDERQQPSLVDDGRDELVTDLVEIIRQIKPDVLFTNHDTSTAWPNAQHGHHQALGIAAYEAFQLAADPTYRQEQLAQDGLDLWQPSRLFLRVRPFWNQEGADYDAAVPVGDECAATTVRPTEACADRAVAAVSQHVSQGFDVFAPRFRQDTTYFRLLASADGAPALPENATDLAAGLAPNTAFTLALETLIDSGRLAPLDGLAVLDSTLVPTESAYLTWPSDARGDSLAVPPPPGAPTRGLFAATTETAAIASGRLRVPIASGTTPTAPLYRTQYTRDDGTPPLVYAVYEDGALIAGGRLPVEIVPPATVDLDAEPIRLRSGTTAIPVEVTIYESTRESVDVSLTLYRDDRAVWNQIQTSEGEALTFAVELDDAAPGDYRVQVAARTTGCGLPWFVEERPATVLPDVAVAPGLRVGYVESYDGTMADALEVMGAEVVRLDSTALAAGDFAGLHTVVVDIRATMERADLVAHRQRLLDWVETGGHLVVGYHKTFEWREESEIAPFALPLTRDRVTDETAPVTVVAPEHPLFRSPHAIADADWEGWVQERGLYFPGEADDRYQRLLEVSDPGEAPLTTGLLLAEVGSGTYIYSPLVWYRQLDALTPGAWRMFANLVSLPLVDGRGDLGSR
ncbi:MAG: PIG-L family deacetylase [Bacteroidota bacterium]